VERVALVSVDEHGRPDGVWRIESHGAALYDVRYRNLLVLQRVSMDRAVAYMLEQGADPSRLVER
jgi:hypothetical protein